MKKIDSLNDVKKPDESIILLDKITRDPKQSTYDKYYAYLLKARTYKRLYNHTEALNNLDRAMLEGKKSNKAAEVESQVLMEKLFIHFDLKQKQEFQKLLPWFTAEKLQYIKGETRVFYESILGHLEMEKGNYEAAEKYFDYCILLLEKESPRHLPNIYKVIMNLYNRMGKKDLAMEAYEKGVYYAEKYDVDLYKIVMDETLLYYYIENEDYKNAYFTQRKLSEMRLKYNDREVSGNLVLLEKKLDQENADMEIKYDRMIKYFLIAIMMTLFALLIVMYLLFRANNRQKDYMEKENQAMRDKLQSLLVNSLQDAAQMGKSIDLNRYKLTERQLEIIQLVKENKSNKEISAMLFISENTVKYHLKKIFEILDIDKRSDLKAS
ncbi:helix-turn-helix transcriptional regulator [Sphingobacterium sp. CZ-2]|uniref:helix-turn-helix transcriptional regulator n=1 Tax=Sphingobacterium sp. CZ-2 TaxID=2557994 RepID=UPI001430919B|nr:LuxR family transcriptional regulator [Sphingobacterium sp. CZ-2]